MRKECFEKADEARSKGDQASANDYINQVMVIISNVRFGNGHQTKKFVLHYMAWYLVVMIFTYAIVIANLAVKVLKKELLLE